MKSITERIEFHDIEKRKLYNKKDILERKLNTINEKIIYHWAAIQNLEKKKKVKDNNWKITSNSNLSKSEGDAHIG